MIPKSKEMYKRENQIMKSINDSEKTKDKPENPRNPSSFPKKKRKTL